MIDSAGDVGDTIEWRMQFREFVRLELPTATGAVWYRASDEVPRRIHVKLRKVNTGDPGADPQPASNITWVDNGSTAANDEEGWDDD